MDLELVDQRLSRVEVDLSRVDAAVDSLREALTAERVATSALSAQVSAHAKRSNERHSEILSAIQIIREEHRDAARLAAQREARLVKITLTVIGVLSTAISGYFRLVAK